MNTNKTLKLSKVFPYYEPTLCSNAIHLRLKIKSKKTKKKKNKIKRTNKRNSFMHLYMYTVYECQHLRGKKIKKEIPKQRKK